MAYGKSNGHVTDDVMWPRKVKLVTPIRLEPTIPKTAEMQFSNNRLLLDNLMWGSKVVYPSDNLASC